ncbi:cobalamin B12-binding domain-containing protein [Nocardioides rubriscoriae]|uniref:cobalamin B12-binding domain-containing protein n=1 Tax=Nocardioides rubriscoriae TaxID=642762 RepID=UPI0011DFD02C|nr:cobalamin-dependent protein [Nocardioides rubriscoriae]
MNQVRTDYWTALQSGDRLAALDVVKAEQARGRTATEVIDDLVVPAQARIGELWLAGVWDVEQEARATEINEGLVHWLGSFAPPPHPDRPTVVVACVEHERHSLPALVVAEGLTWAGFRVVYLGGDPDPDRMMREVLGTRPRAVLFSASLTSSLAGQKRVFGELRATGIPVVVGGSAFGGDPARAEALGATAYAADLDAAIELLETLPRRVTPVQVPERTPADVEAEWILEQRHVLTEGVVARLVDRLGTGVPPSWWPDLVGHVDHVVGCLAAAVVTGDETIVVEVRDWLAHVVEARGGEAGVVTELWSLLAVPLRGHPLARIHLAAAATAAAAPQPVLSDG